MSKSGLLTIIIVSGTFFNDLRAEHPAETVAMGGTVSVEELLNPLEGKALRTILNAQKDLRSGHQARAMETLRQALSDPRALPYAISMLGIEHLKAGQLDVALSELEEAIRLLPSHAELHSNLAFLLATMGDYDRALVEARKALQLNPSRARTRLVLGKILLVHKETADEGAAHLKMVAAELPSAHLALAAYYQWKGQTEAAEHEKRAYSGSVPAGAMSFQPPQR